MVYARLSAFFKKHSVFTKTQYGFRSNKSTTPAVMDVITTVYDQINANEYTSMTLSDFKKAFNTVKPSFFYEKLERYGICSVALDLLTSFLTNPKQYVIAHNDNFSDVAINKFGVHQESNLGPVLFLICIKNISTALNSMPKLFVDDTCIIIHQSNQAALTEETNRELTNVYQWTQVNKITENPQKSSSLIIPPKTANNTCDIEISFDNSIITLQDCVNTLALQSIPD